MLSKSACLLHSDSQEDKYRSSFVIHADLLCYQMNAFSGAGESIVASQQEGQGLILPFLCGVFARSVYACVLVLQVRWRGIAIKKIKIRNYIQIHPSICWSVSLSCCVSYWPGSNEWETGTRRCRGKDLTSWCRHIVMQHFKLWLSLPPQGRPGQLGCPAGRRGEERRGGPKACLLLSNNSLKSVPDRLATNFDTSYTDSI